MDSTQRRVILDTMAYSDDAVKAKLNSLNETQDSIVANAQWIMFHRRHADRTASLWLQRLQESSVAKRLNLIYLANEVVQQSRARGKQDFMLAFEPVVAEATAMAYKGASQDVQGKIKRVVEVWRQRNIFDVRILESVDARIAELDKSKGGKMGGKLGGSLFGGGGGSVPAELDGIAKSQAAVAKAEATLKPAVNTANTEFAKLVDPNTPLPTPPVHAARLSALMRNLASAQGAVEASINARKELLAGLEKLVESNRGKLLEDEATASDLATRKENIENKKREVEDGIMRGLSNPSSPNALTPTEDFPDSAVETNGIVNGHDDATGPAAPEAEGFTPPPPDVESFTPPPAAESLTSDPTTIPGQATFTGVSLADATSAEALSEPPANLNEPPPAFEPPPVLDFSRDSAAAADDFLNNLNSERVRQASTEIPALAMNGNPGDPRLKRRKMSHPKPTANNVDEDIFGAEAVGGMDEDGVAAMLGQ